MRIQLIGIRTVTLLTLFILLTSNSYATSDPPFLLPPQKKLNKIRTAIIYTNRGNLQFKLFPEEAPWHVSNFKYRADKGYYRGTTFHIFYQDYIIQGGGPQRNPVYSAPYTLPAEFNEHQHLKGALGMARKPDYANPERRSSGNQFHILLGDTPRMDGSFTVFGMIERGSELLSKLGKGDQIIDIKVFVRPE